MQCLLTAGCSTIELSGKIGERVGRKNLSTRSPRHFLEQRPWIRKSFFVKCRSRQENRRKVEDGHDRSRGDRRGGAGGAGGGDGIGGTRVCRHATRSTPSRRRTGQFVHR